MEYDPVSIKKMGEKWDSTLHFLLGKIGVNCPKIFLNRQ